LGPFGAFISPFQHTKQCILSRLYTTVLLWLSKTLYPGGIRTRVFFSLGECDVDCAMPPVRSRFFFALVNTKYICMYPRCQQANSIFYRFFKFSALSKYYCCRDLFLRTASLQIRVHFRSWWLPRSGWMAHPRDGRTGDATKKYLANKKTFNLLSSSFPSIIDNVDKEAGSKTDFYNTEFMISRKFEKSILSSSLPTYLQALPI
jgi:hypothetical protein